MFKYLFICLLNDDDDVSSIVDWLLYDAFVFIIEQLSFVDSSTAASVTSDTSLATADSIDSNVLVDSILLNLIKFCKWINQKKNKKKINKSTIIFNYQVRKNI